MAELKTTTTIRLRNGQVLEVEHDELIELRDALLRLYPVKPAPSPIDSVKDVVKALERVQNEKRHWPVIPPRKTWPAAPLWPPAPLYVGDVGPNPFEVTCGAT